VPLNESSNICATQFREPEGAAAKSLPKELIREGQVIALGCSRQPTLFRKVSLEVGDCHLACVNRYRRSFMVDNPLVPQHAKELAWHGARAAIAFHKTSTGFKITLHRLLVDMVGIESLTFHPTAEVGYDVQMHVSGAA
jgi:hypothetical protein